MDLKMGTFWRHLSKTEEDEDKQILIHSVIIHRFFFGRIESHKKSKLLEDFFSFLFYFISIQVFYIFVPEKLGYSLF